MRLSDAPLFVGSWTIMARTNAFARDFAEQLRVLGYYYSLKGKPSVDPQRVLAMRIWEKLQAGESVPVMDLCTFYSVVPKQGDKKVVERGGKQLMEQAPMDAAYDYWELVKNFKLVAPKESDAYQIANLNSRKEFILNPWNAWVRISHKHQESKSQRFMP